MWFCEIMDVRKCFQEGQWMDLRAASSRVLLDTTCDIEEPLTHFSAMTALDLSTDGVKMNKSPQKCKVNGKRSLWGLWWFGLSVFPLQLVVSQWFRFQALVTGLCLWGTECPTKIKSLIVTFFFLFLPLQNHGKSKNKESPQGRQSTRWEQCEKLMIFRSVL